jgi:hypothetical protein
MTIPIERNPPAMPVTLSDPQRERLTAVAARTADMTNAERAGWARLRDAYSGDDRTLIQTALGEVWAPPARTIGATARAQLRQRFPDQYPA